ncbi:MAG: hypothetical protein ACT4OZ_16825 [Gemmatimonadota bacterium]
MRTARLGFCLALALVPNLMQGQTCAGLPSFANTSANVFGALTIFEGAKQLGAGAAFGRDAGPFVSVSGSRTSLDDDAGSALGADVAAGLQMPLGSERKAWLCPAAGAGYSNGPSDEFEGVEFKVTGQALSAGLLVGVLASGSETLEVIPTGGFSLVYSRVSLSVAGESESDSDTFGVLSGGVGLVFNKTFGVKPFVNIPLGLEDSDPSFGVIVSVGIPRR